MSNAIPRFTNDSGRSTSQARLPRGNARERALETLRAEIIALHLPPGAALSENELAAQLGVSRTPVRESLIMLQSEGLVQVIPQIGTFVALVDPGRVAEAQFIREAIECSSLGSVDHPVAQADSDALAENLRRQSVCAAQNDAEAFFELDEDYHRTLLRIAGHESAWRTVTSHKAHLDRARHLSLGSLRPLTGLVEQHRSVADALVAGDGESAVASLRAHLREIFDDVEAIRSARPDLFQESSHARPFRKTVAELR
ncbi:MAG: GntR family transcriptional regulator [Cryobacterium sp.]|nr:GntR family transcriptional regulator [Cryobacterium sp.]